MRTSKPQPGDPDPSLQVGCTNRRKRGIEEESMVSIKQPKMVNDPSSAEKSENAIEMMNVDEDTNTTRSESYGIISMIGRRRIMEDAAMAAPGISGYDFYAVYDGHGNAEVANACRDRMLDLVGEDLEEVRGKGLVIEWQRLMRECFKNMDDELEGGEVEDEDGGVFSVRTVGSSAAVAMVGKEEVVVANCGDSRTVLSRRGLAVPLSRDHKPDRQDEKERVEAAGINGRLILGMLSSTRSIGDHNLKPYVIADPDVTVSDRTEGDHFLIIASDGLWDVISNERACEVVKWCLDCRNNSRFSEESRNYAIDAALMLVELALAQGSTDNISVIVVELAKFETNIA